MALLMFDGFEVYDVAADLIAGGLWKKGYGVDNTANFFRTGAASGFSYYTESLTTKDLGDPSTIIFGAGIMYRTSLDTHEGIVVRGDQGNTVARVDKTSGAGTLKVYNGAGTLLFTSGAVYGATQEYHYIELKVTINGASGQIVLRVDGSELYNSGPIDVQAGASTGIRDVCVGNPSNSIGFDHIHVDDVYVCDDSGATNNDFLGPVRVAKLNPSSDASVQWAPNSGATNYTQVDEIGMAFDADSTYVSSNTVGHKDLYGLTDLNVAYTSPVAVQAFYFAKHDNSSGGASMASVLKAGATEQEGTENVLSSSYKLFADTLLVNNPDTSAAWSVSDINALQLGAIVKSNL